MSKSTTAIEIERLTTEHAALTRLQYEALQRSAYARMPKSDADAYDTRLFRIIEIHRELAKFRKQSS
jgi:hypothetical protein